MTLDAFDVALEVFDVTLEESGRRVLNGKGGENGKMLLVRWPIGKLVN